MGTVDECVAQLKEHLAAGVQKLIFVPVQVRDGSDRDDRAGDHPAVEGLSAARQAIGDVEARDERVRPRLNRGAHRQKRDEIVGPVDVLLELAILHDRRPDAGVPRGFAVPPEALRSEQRRNHARPAGRPARSCLRRRAPAPARQRRARRAAGRSARWTRPTIAADRPVRPACRRRQPTAMQPIACSMAELSPDGDSSATTVAPCRRAISAACLSAVGTSTPPSR